MKRWSFGLLLPVLFVALFSATLSASEMSARLRFSKRMNDVHVLGAAISPDSRLIATLNGDHSIGFWDLHNGKSRGTLLGHKGRLMRISMSNDGRYLATGVFSGEKVKIWELPSGKFVRELAQFDDLSSLALSPDGQLLAAAGVPAGDGKNGAVELWDVAKGTRAAVLMKEKLAQFYPGSLRFSPDGKFLAAAIQNTMHGIMIWDVPGRRLAKTIKHSHDVIAIAYSPDGSVIAGGGMGNSVYVWDVQKGRVVHEGKGHTGHITDVSFHPGGRFFATSSFGTKSRFRVWDSQTGKQVFVLAEPRRRSQNVMFSNDGKTLAVVLIPYGNLGDPATLEVYDMSLSSDR